MNYKNDNDKNHKNQRPASKKFICITDYFLDHLIRKITIFS